jgi:phenylalanyl-tRNA synthetase beta chain
MLVPVSWLKDYIEIKLPLKDLMWRLTEIGLTSEKLEKINGEEVLDIEVTANRPDWMSILGVAYEIAAIQGNKVKEPQIKELAKSKKTLEIKLKNNFQAIERWSAIIISGIAIKPSPEWLQKRILSVGLRPINNVVDITNFVMFEMGMPMHAFDYDEIKGHEMTVMLSQGGEEFTSVDELSYKLPKDAIIIKDKERIIDLAGIKGGLNSGIKANTKNIVLHSTINNPVLIRRTSIALGLRSDASAIYERGPDKGGTVKAIKRAANLILETAGGEVASDLIDLKQKEFKPYSLDLNLKKLKEALGIEIKKDKVVKIFSSLNLNPKAKGEKITCIIPTKRSDLKIEEDLIEEVARIYGYNNFPLTLPEGKVKEEKIAYFKDEKIEKRLREIMIASGYSETMNYSLISEKTIRDSLSDPEKHIKIKNPVSLDYQYLRSSLIPSLILATKLNIDKAVKLFEMDKVFPEERYKVSAIGKGIEFREFKGTIDLILERLGIENYKIIFEVEEPIFHPAKSGTIKIKESNIGYFGEINPQVRENFAIKEILWAFELDLETLKNSSKIKTFVPVSNYPPQIEDLTFVFPAKTKIGEVVESIRKTSDLIRNVELKDIYQDAFTFRITYQSNKKTLNDTEIASLREKIIEEIKKKYAGSAK